MCRMTARWRFQPAAPTTKLGSKDMSQRLQPHDWIETVSLPSWAPRHGGVGRPLPTVLRTKSQATESVSITKWLFWGHLVFGRFGLHLDWGYGWRYSFSLLPALGLAEQGGSEGNLTSVWRKRDVDLDVVGLLNQHLQLSISRRPGMWEKLIHSCWSLRWMPGYLSLVVRSTPTSHTQALLVRFGRLVEDKIWFLTITNCLIGIKVEIVTIVWSSEKFGCEENEGNELVAGGWICLWANVTVHEEIPSKPTEMKAGERTTSAIIVTAQPTLALSVFSQSRRLSWEFLKQSRLHGRTT